MVQEKIFYMEAVEGMCTHCYHIKAKNITDAKSRVYKDGLKKDRTYSEITAEEICLTKM